jgi:FkbM family methyltransferase
MWNKNAKNYIYLIIIVLVFLLIGNLTLKIIYSFVQTPVERYFNKYFEDNRPVKLIDFSSYVGSLNERSNFDLVKTRDFIRYECEKIVRLGGSASQLKAAPSEMTRLEGAWYVCLDRALKPQANNCTLLSFGIHEDYTFDVAIKKAYSCRVHSFDPQVEAVYFSQIRQKNPSLQNAPILEIERNWTFYKLGLSDRSSKENLNSLQPGDMLDFESMLELTNMENKIIDILKIDIEGGEKNVLRTLNMSYACKFVKQLLVETHANFRFKELVKLEECFYLFHRDTRFFLDEITTSKWGFITEFHNPNGFKLELKPFKNEMNLAEFMFVTGELYFVNINFVMLFENKE